MIWSLLNWAPRCDGVSSRHFGKIVAQLEAVINLVEAVGVGSDREIIEENVFYALISGQRDNAQRPWSGYKALRGQADTQPANRLAEIVCVAPITEPKFIDGAGSKRLRVAQHS